jgi:pyridoxine kinase
VQTPKLPMKANGSSDVTAALFTAHVTRTGDAAAHIASRMFDPIARTLELGERELQLVEPQWFYPESGREFAARQVRRRRLPK